MNPGKTIVGVKYSRDTQTVDVLGNDTTITNYQCFNIKFNAAPNSKYFVDYKEKGGLMKVWATNLGTKQKVYGEVSRKCSAKPSINF